MFQKNWRPQVPNHAELHNHSTKTNMDSKNDLGTYKVGRRLPVGYKRGCNHDKWPEITPINGVMRPYLHLVGAHLV